MENKETQIDLLKPSEIENADFALYDWLDKELNLFCSSKDGDKKVPVIWVTPERAFQIKQNAEFRDINGALNPPMMTVERSGINKDQKNSATFFANLPPKSERFNIAKRINQKKTSEFANADMKRLYNPVGFVRPRKNEKVVYEFREMLMPVYVTFTYNISVFTQFQQQMNEIVQPFITKTGSTRYFLIERDGYKYECFIEPNIETKNNIGSMEEEERRYVTVITIKVLANLMGLGANQSDSIIKSFENAVEIKLPRDGVIIAKQSEEKQFAPPQPTNIAKTLSSNIAFKKTFTIGDAVNETYIVQHNLNSRDMYVAVRENFGPDYAIVTVSINHVNLNTISIDMGDVIPTDSYVVTIIG